MGNAPVSVSLLLPLIRICVHSLYPNVADDYSTSYQFSLYDDTWISSHLELSGGDNTVELLRTQLCYEGTISYGINMLKVCTNICMFYMYLCMFTC